MQCAPKPLSPISRRGFVPEICSCVARATGVETGIPPDLDFRAVLRAFCSVC